MKYAIKFLWKLFCWWENDRLRCTFSTVFQVDAWPVVYVPRLVTVRDVCVIKFISFFIRVSLFPIDHSPSPFCRACGCVAAEIWAAEMCIHARRRTERDREAEIERHSERERRGQRGYACGSCTFFKTNTFSWPVNVNEIKNSCRVV